MLAFCIRGDLTSTEIADRATVKQVFHPDEDKRDIYDQMYEGYRLFYKQNKSVFRTLNG